MIVGFVGVVASALTMGGAPAADTSRHASVRPDTTSIVMPPSGERGAGFGVDMNSLANEVSAGLQVSVPVSTLFAVVARPMLAGGAMSRDLDVGGRVELQLRSPVYDNRIRVYLGVGPQGFYELRGEDAHSHDISGGWDAGAEVFVSPRFGVHWEMGTSGGDVTAGAGPAFSVGFRAYPWK